MKSIEKTPSTLTILFKCFSICFSFHVKCQLSVWQRWRVNTLFWIIPCCGAEIIFCDFCHFLKSSSFGHIRFPLYDDINYFEIILSYMHVWLWHHHCHWLHLHDGPLICCCKWPLRMTVMVCYSQWKHSVLQCTVTGRKECCCDTVLLTPLMWVKHMWQYLTTTI